jgi:hypothetical protein
MPTLHGLTLSRRELERRVGHARQLFGVDLMQYDDGAQRGVRVLEFRTGAGLAFSVLVDRSMDIGHFDHRGTPMAWQSATGFRQPQLLDPMGDQGAGFMRGFSGLLCTCGLDHIRQPDRGSASHFDLPLRTDIHYPMHGRGAFQPALLDGYGVRWEGDECWLWCEGTITQAQVFGEHLTLTRRVEARVGGTSVEITDTVTNQGFPATPHMLLYHINLGWPLLDEGARMIAPVTAIRSANMPPEVQQTGYRVQSAPMQGHVQQVLDLEFVAEADGRVPVALVNDRIGLGFALEFDASVFRCLQQWQAFGEGVYGFGLEPATSHWGSRADADSAGEIIWLQHLQSRTYRSRLSVLDGTEAIAAHETRVERIAPQLQDGFAPRTAQPQGGPYIARLPLR